LKRLTGSGLDPETKRERGSTVTRPEMRTGTVELKFRDGTAIKIKGSIEFATAVMKVVLEVGDGKSSEHVQETSATPKL
jgi:hypothetical protein